MRLLLVVDPYATEGRYDEFASQVFLLRLPQLVLVAAVENTACGWWFIAEALGPPLPHSKTKVLYIAAIV